MPDARAHTLSIVTMGGRFERLAQRDDKARVVAVFGRSVHVMAGDDYGCIGAPSIGNGPLNAIVDEAGLTLLPRINVGDAINADVRQAARWRPPPVPAAFQAQRLAESTKRVREIASRLAPQDGLARAALGLAAQHTPLLRLAAPRLEALGTWLDSSMAGIDARSPIDAPPPTDLLGLGPGLTPSGDDLLSGLLIALRACGRATTADALGNAIVPAARTATTALSCAMLGAASEGEGAEALHLAINDMLAGNLVHLPQRVDRLARIGHTSGWDALAGALLALHANKAGADAPST